MKGSMAKGDKDLTRKRNAPPQVTFSPFSQPELGGLPARVDIKAIDLVSSDEVPEPEEIQTFSTAALAPELVARSGMSYREYLAYRKQNGLD